MIGGWVGESDYNLLLSVDGGCGRTDGHITFAGFPPISTCRSL